MRSACAFSPYVALVGLVFSVAASGCASEGDALEKRFAKLQEELTRVQSQTDRMAERLDAVELRQATAPQKEERVASAAPETVSRSKLKVVRVESEGEVSPEETVNTQAEESGPRVVIQGEGKSLETRTMPSSQKSTPKAETQKSAPKSESKPQPAKKPDSPAPK
jgi:alpha-acetolactate decarboxylase